MVELLFLPALIGYGEAAVAYAGEAWHPGRAGKLATWGVRLGWLAQTALIAVLFARSDGFPWDTWAGTLNLFVWLVVGIYLVWGCRARYRLLGLTIMPLAAGLLARVLVGRRRCVPRSSRLLDAVPRLPRRARARSLRGAHPGRRDVGAVSLRRAAAQARGGRPPSSGACRRSSRWTRSRHARCS